MTIVAAVSTTFDAVVIADSRLSIVDSKGAVSIVRDVCQKLIVVNGWSIVGFAGHLCLARHLLAAVGNRLRATPYDTPLWLLDDSQLKQFVSGCIQLHVREVADHRICQSMPAELLITWVNYTRSIIAGDHKLGDALFVPGTEIITIRTPEMTIRRTYLGIDVIGSGAVIAPGLRQQAMLKIANFARWQEHGDANRCYFTAEVVRSLLDEAGGVPTVGGLYQMVHLSPRGVEVMPYFYWARVAPGYGTYVAMRFEDGYWVQEHRPTGTKLRVLSPWDIQLKGPDWLPGKHEIFDPSATLTRESPGVLPEPNSRLLFHVYDPSNVPPLIRASWGEQPIPPLTWATKPLRRKGRKLLSPRAKRRRKHR